MPRAAWALSLAAMAVVGLGATGCKRKAEEPAAQESLPEQHVVAEWLPEPEPLRETGVFENELGPYVGQEDDRNRYSAAVMISRGNPRESVDCSGVLVSPRLVLTSGSCVCTSRPVEIPGAAEKTLIDASACAKHVSVASLIHKRVLDERSDTLREERFRIYPGEVRPHPDLELRLDARGAVVSSRADLAAIVLDTPVEAEPVAASLAEVEVQAGESLVMAGYVRNTPQAIGGFMGVRYYRRNKVLKVSAEGTLLYEQPGASVYNGYMGGPCFREKGAVRALVGIASVDSDEQPSFTSTHVFRDWVAAEIRRAAGRSGPSSNNSKKE